MKFQSFYLKQTEKSKAKYKDLLKGVAQTSFIYSISEKPYLHYRALENIFCVSFRANNISRKDCSIDAIKLNEGIGVKTFLSNCVRKYEKIAEFDDPSKYNFKYSQKLKLARQVSDFRNNRLRKDMKNYDLKNCLYHYVVRDTGKLAINECPMSLINIDKIQLETKRSRKHIIKFNDGAFDYHFHTTKHTLYKAFSVYNTLDEILISKDIETDLMLYAMKELARLRDEDVLMKKYEYVILPLFSTRTGDIPLKSGLNQWNAGGRKRDPDEIYIPIPRVVHKKNKGFFPPRDKRFNLHTPDGKIFVAKVCQENSKSLMSKNNKELGKWLLRDVLEIPYGEIVSYKHLRKKDSDTVMIFKIDDENYKITLYSFGGFKN